MEMRLRLNDWRGHHELFSKPVVCRNTLCTLSLMIQIHFEICIVTIIISSFLQSAKDVHT